MPRADNPREGYLFQVELHGGTVGLVAARNLEAARRKALAEEGSSNVKNVRLATQAEVDWIQGMGGRIPAGRVRREPKRRVGTVDATQPKGAMLREALTRLREAEREGRYERANELQASIMEAYA